MTINELIALLREYDGDTEVVINEYPVMGVIELPDGDVQIETAE